MVGYTRETLKPFSHKFVWIDYTDQEGTSRHNKAFVQARADDYITILFSDSDAVAGTKSMQIKIPNKDISDIKFAE